MKRVKHIKTGEMGVIDPQSNGPRTFCSDYFAAVIWDGKTVGELVSWDNLVVWGKRNEV
jgi:hypothetical protein